MVQRTGGFGKRKSAGGLAQPQRLVRPTDKRADERAPAFRKAKLIISGNTELECAVRDVSDHGCMVSLFGAENLPDQVTIKLDPATPRRAARVVWREERDAGLEFLAPDES